MLYTALLALSIVIEPNTYTPEPGAYQAECQSYYRPMLHTLLRAWPKSAYMTGAQRRQLYEDINEMLRTLDRQNQLSIKCQYLEREL